MTVSAVIVNYRTAAFLPLLLKDLAASPPVSTIFLVDNSGEIDLPRLTQDAGLDSGTGPLIELIQPGRNLGFAAAVNLAASRVDSEFVLLVNPDLRLLEGCVDQLVKACTQTQAVIAGPRFFWDDDRQFRLPPSQGTTSWMAYALAASQHSSLDRQLLSFYWEMRHDRFWEKIEPFAEPFLSGACLLIDRGWACRNGATVLDDRYFLYHEDNDVCVRAMNDGHPPLCVPAAEVVHYYNQAPEPEQGKGALMMDSHQQYRDKHYPHVSWEMNILEDRPDPVPDLNLSDVPGPRFDWAGFQPWGRLYLEIGIEPHFVPFAQTELGPDSQGKWPEMYHLPSPILDRLSSGIYYTRLRDDIKGTRKVWKWQNK